MLNFRSHSIQSSYSSNKLKQVENYVVRFIIIIFNNLQWHWTLHLSNLYHSYFLFQTQMLRNFHASGLGRFHHISYLIRPGLAPSDRTPPTDRPPAAKEYSCSLTGKWRKHTAICFRDACSATNTSRLMNSNTNQPNNSLSSHRNPKAKDQRKQDFAFTAT